jgi:hypothetical protein
MGNSLRYINSKILKYQLIIITLLASAILLGIVFPGSFSDHDTLLHFSAHFGISFLISFVLYKILTIRFQWPRLTSFVIVFLVILAFGAIYKIFEISGNSLIQYLPFSKILRVTGFYISMSQNTAGILCAFALIIYFDNFLKFLNKRKAENSGKI